MNDKFQKCRSVSSEIELFYLKTPYQANLDAKKVQSFTT